MSLTPSCANLYFPAEPHDNIIALKWNTGDTPLEPNTSVIFKVKCTAPQLFYVVPRYGALLLADATGASVQSFTKSTEITFGLREHHVGAEDDGAANNGGGGGAAPSTINRASTARASRAASATPGGPAYQERFAVEYVMIKSEPLAFQQIFNTLSDHGKLTEVVKSMWSLVASGAIPRAHLGVQASINMKVFMENVVQRRGDAAPSSGEEAAMIVVPPEARLVAPGAHDRASAANARNPSSANSHRTSENASATNGTPPSTRRKAVDELRALKEEINCMRRDSGASLSGSPHNIASPNATSTPNAQRAGEARRLMNSLSPPQNNVTTAAVPGVPSDDVVMKFTVGGDGVGAAGKKKAGLKVYVVLVLMFVLYVFVLIMRRGARPGSEMVAAVTGGDTATAMGSAVQVSSRELETRTG